MSVPEWKRKLQEREAEKKQREEAERLARQQKMGVLGGGSPALMPKSRASPLLAARDRASPSPAGSPKVSSAATGPFTELNVVFRRIGRPAAEELLEPCKPGAYVVRPSSRPGCLSLSYRREASAFQPKVAHLLLIKNPTSGQWCKEDDQGKHFPTVRALLEWLTKTLYLNLNNDDLPGQSESATGPLRLFADAPPTIIGFDIPPLVTPEDSTAYRVEVGEELTVDLIDAKNSLQEMRLRRGALQENISEVEGILRANGSDEKQYDVMRVLKQEVQVLDQKIAQVERHIRDPSSRVKDLEVELEAVSDIYAEEFMTQPHMNFIGQPGDKEGGEYVHEVVSALRLPTGGYYKGLRVTRKQTVRFEIPEKALKTEKKKDVSAAIARYLNEQRDDGDYYYVHNHEAFSKDLSQIEVKHPQRKHAVKMALILSTPEKPTGKENNTPTPAFTKFCNLMGQVISLKDWKGYRGDMGKDSEQDTYFAKWRGIDVMYHVSTMLSPEQHRRLVGNDIAVVFFRENGAVNLDEVDLGTVPQVHAVVSPFQHQNQEFYRVAFFSRTTIKPFGPPLPKQLVFRPSEIQHFLLGKMINGLVSAMIYSPPMNRLFFRPRGAAIEELYEKYPKESDKKVREREKAAALERRKLRESYAGLPRQLTVHIKAANGLASKDKDGLCSPFVAVKLQEQIFKTEVVKRTAAPVWNASFSFSLVGVEIGFATIEFNVYEKGLISDEFMGHCVVSLSEALKNKQEQSLTLQPRPGLDSAVTGELVIKFEAELPEIHTDGDAANPIDLTTFDWYHGALSGQEAFNLVNNQPAGAFLVRTSTKRAGGFVVTYKHSSNAIIHVLLLKRDDGWHGEGMHRGFKTLQAILERYSKSYSHPVSNQGKWTRLLEKK